MRIMRLTVFDTDRFDSIGKDKVGVVVKFEMVGDVLVYKDSARRGFCNDS